MADIDVTDREQLEAFLKTILEREGGKSQVVAFAAHSALRVVPIFSQFDVSATSHHPSDIILPLLRAVAVSWVAGTYPTHDTARSALSALSAADSALSALSAADSALSALSARSARSAARSALSALSALSAADSALSALSAADSALSALSAADSALSALSARSARSARSALNADVDSLDAGQSLSDQALWPTGIPAAMAEDWQALSEKLLNLDEGWQVWTDWYEARLQGKPAHKLSATANERIEVARVLEIEEDDWKQGAAHVNAKIKAIIERERERDTLDRTENSNVTVLSGGLVGDPPPEPDPGPGPTYSVQEGQLHLDPSPPAQGDQDTSAALLPLLQQATDRLYGQCQKLDNTHPQLASAVRDYATSLNAPFDQLNVPTVWAHGGLLAELKQGFDTQSSSMMTEALEPEVAAFLANVVRQHAAFILGTEQGRELIERADRFQQAPETIKDVREPAQEILDELSDNEDLVNAETRAAHAPIRDYLRTIEWGACRTSYAGYIIVRKAVFTMLRIVVGREASLLAIVGGATAFGTLAGDPNLEFLRTALPVLRDHAAAILAFYKHSPELRSYAEYALRLIETADKKELDPRVKPEDDDR